MASTIILVVQIYLAIGVVFALAFLFAAVGKVSPNTRGSSPLFRLLVLPGTVALWPWVLFIWRTKASAEERI